MMFFLWGGVSSVCPPLFPSPVFFGGCFFFFFPPPPLGPPLFKIFFFRAVSLVFPSPPPPPPPPPLSTCSPEIGSDAPASVFPHPGTLVLSTCAQRSRTTRSPCTQYDDGRTRPHCTSTLLRSVPSLAAASLLCCAALRCIEVACCRKVPARLDRRRQPGRST
jgi:hypothetical protein